MCVQQVVTPCLIGRVFVCVSVPCPSRPAGTYEDRAVPTRIKALVGKEIERVAGGQHHTIFLRRDGVVYGCGSCKLGQVSDGQQQQQRAHSANLCKGQCPARFELVTGASTPASKHAQPEVCLCLALLLVLCCVVCVPHIADQQVPGSLHRMSPDRTVPIPIKLHLPFQPSKRDRERLREREARNSGSNLTTVVEAAEEQQAQAQSLQQQRPSASGSIRQSSGGGGSATSSRSGVAVGPVDPQQQQMRSKCPVVHQIVAGGNSSIFLTRAPEEIPEVYTINLLAK